MRQAPPLAGRLLVPGAAAAAIIAVVNVITGGFNLHLGTLELRSHDPLRPLVASVILLGVAWRLRMLGDALAWHWEALERFAGAMAATLAVLTIAAGFYWGAFIAGGSDSYCYLNQAELIARGTVRDYEPLAEDPAWPGNFWSFAPAGHMPVGEPVPSMVPICPTGYPLLMAGARLVAGRSAMFWITPIFGGLAVFLTFALGRRLGGPIAGLLAALLTATSPTVLYQLFQPMNDVTAAALWTAVILAVLWSETRKFAGAIAAGLLTGAALLVRPNLLPLAAAAGLGVMFLPRARSVMARVRLGAVFAVAAAPGPLVVLLVQNAMYGSPFTSGYGDLDQIFAWAHVVPNLRRYAQWVMETHTPIVAVSLAAPFALRRFGSSRIALWLLVFAALTLACYLPYVVFDAWWYTRFLMPGLLPVLALTAAAAVVLFEALPAPARFLPAVIGAAALTTLMLQTGAARDVFRIRDLERRFRSVGEYVATLPSNAAFITLHHSGSIRFYAHRSTVGWADVNKGEFDAAVEFLRRHGRKPYLVFEAWEEPQFRERFAGERLGQLSWRAMATVDGVKIYDPDDFAR